MLSAAIVLTCFLSLLLYPGLDFFYIKYFNLVGIFYLGSFVYVSSATKKQVLFILGFSLIVYSLVYFINEATLKADFLLLVIVSLTAYFIGFANKIPLRMNNDISYGLYIFAFPIQQALFKLTNFNPSISLQLVLTFAITVPLAFLSWKFIEKPFINMNRKFSTPG
jgi:peptidoglycan/LPS O-acetylase OafA/YrhL